MLKFVRAAVIGAALFSPAVLASPAAAGVFRGTVTGTFGNLQTTGAFINTNGSLGYDNDGSDAVSTGGGSSSISWGATGGFDGFSASTLTFTGTDFAFAHGFDPEAGLFGTYFKIGTLSYYNGTSVTGSLIYGADLDLEVSNAFVGEDTPVEIGGADLSLAFLSTVNTGISPARDADFLTFNDLDTTFNVVEGGTATIDLYAVIIGDPQMFFDHIDNPLGDGVIGNGVGGGAVPEPASWALMIIGFGGIGVTMRRRRTLGLSAA